MRVAVLGASPAGLTAAYQLAKAGVEVEVFEAAEQVGGLCRSFELWGQQVDLGPQPFTSADARVNSLWLEVVEDDFQWMDQAAGIYFDGRLTGALSSARDSFSADLSEADQSQRAKWWQKRGGAVPTQAADCAAWIEHYCGRQRLDQFYRAYYAKLAGMPCEQLDADFAAGRFRDGLRRSRVGEILDRWRRRRSEDRLAYPVGGAGMVYERMADYVRGLGGNVRLQCRVAGLLLEADRIRGVKLASGETATFDHVVTTLPFRELLAGFDGVPQPILRAADRLRMRKAVIVYVQVESRRLFAEPWLDVYAPEFLVSRITNFRNLPIARRTESEHSIVALEYWCSDGDELWRQGKRDLVRRAGAELVASGLLGRCAMREAHVARVRDCFPVHERGYRVPLTDVTDFLDGLPGLTAIGPYGVFGLNAQAEGIRLGLLAAENLLDNRRHCLSGIVAHSPAALVVSPR